MPSFIRLLGNIFICLLAQLQWSLAQRFSARYHVGFSFGTTVCSMVPRFEFGCSSGGSLVMIEKDVYASDKSARPVTCRSHPQKGTRYRLCQADPIGIPVGATGVDSSLYFASFRCDGESANLLMAEAETSATVGTCRHAFQGFTGAYQRAYLSVWDSTDFVYTKSCGTGVLVSSSSSIYACESSLTGCSSSSISSCTVDPLQSARAVFYSIPPGAIREPDLVIDLVGYLVVGAGVSIGVVVIYCCWIKNRKSFTQGEAATVSTTEPVTLVAEPELRDQNGQPVVLNGTVASTADTDLDFPTARCEGLVTMASASAPVTELRDENGQPVSLNGIVASTTDRDLDFRNVIRLNAIVLDYKDQMRNHPLERSTSRLEGAVTTAASVTSAPPAEPILHDENGQPVVMNRTVASTTDGELDFRDVIRLNAVVLDYKDQMRHHPNDTSMAPARENLDP